LGLKNILLKWREGGEGSEVRKKVRKNCCNYLLGIIYKLLDGSRVDGKEVVRKKDPKKVQKKGQIKVRQKGSNDSIAEYCILAEVRKKFEKKVKYLKKSLLKNMEDIPYHFKKGMVCQF
jgi:hypothetical protein